MARRHTCLICGYDRSGLTPAERCPECGSEPRDLVEVLLRPPVRLIVTVVALTLAAGLFTLFYGDSDGKPFGWVAGGACVVGLIWTRPERRYAHARHMLWWALVGAVILVVAGDSYRAIFRML